LNDVEREIDFLQQPPALVQAVAEKSVAALAVLAATGNLAVDLNRIRQLI